MGMTATRIRILENQQTGVTKKVYGAVPINEAWPSKQIVMELSRQGQVRDFSIIEGCLNTLKEVGLIKEMAPGHFQRVKPKPTVEKEAEPMTTKPPNPVISPNSSIKGEPTEPVDRLAAIGTKLRGLSQMFLELADDRLRWPRWPSRRRLQAMTKSWPSCVSSKSC